MAGRLESRLAKIEQILAKEARRKELTACICVNGIMVGPGGEEKMEAEMNQTCPVHGERRLRRLIRTVIVDPTTRLPIPSPELDKLSEEYGRSWTRQREHKFEDDSEDL